jgi:hypothetical protein
MHTHFGHPFMNPRNILLTAALALTMSAFSAHAGQVQSVTTTQAAKSPSIKISALPFTITAPGTYVLTGNLAGSGASGYATAIDIAPTTPGPVVVDLNGFTIDANGNDGVILYGGYPSVANAYPVTIENGTITNYLYGVYASYGGTPGVYMSDILVKNIVFDSSSVNGATAIYFGGVNSSSVNNCTIRNVPNGISDNNSALGNSYSNIAFVNVPSPLFVHPSVATNSTVVLDSCAFSAPPAK